LRYVDGCIQQVILAGIFLLDADTTPAVCAKTAEERATVSGP
jgi:hypothetical protein